MYTHCEYCNLLYIYYIGLIKTASNYSPKSHLHIQYYSSTSTMYIRASHFSLKICGVSQTKWFPNMSLAGKPVLNLRMKHFFKVFKCILLIKKTMYNCNKMFKNLKELNMIYVNFNHLSSLVIKKTLWTPVLYRMKLGCFYKYAYLGLYTCRISRRF